MSRILVLYGTTDGHTRRIAASLGATLRTQGAEVDVIRAGRPGPSPDDYDGIIVAASVHAGGFQRPVKQWVLTHAHEFGDKPTAFVSVCLGFLQQDPAVQNEVHAIVNRFLVATGWRPTITKLVGGALLYRQYNWIKRWVMKRIVAKAGGDTDTSRDYEYTDWNDLRAFAEQFGALVGVARGTASEHAGRRAVTAAVALLAVLGVAQGAWAQNGDPAGDWQHGSMLSGFFGGQAASSQISPAAGAGFGWAVTPHFAMEARGTWFHVNDGSTDFAATFGAHMPVFVRRSVMPFLTAGAGVYLATINASSDSIPAFYRNRLATGAVGTRTFQDFQVTLGGGVDVLMSSHVALRPEAGAMIITSGSNTRTVGVFGLHVVYHIPPQKVGQ